MKLVVNNPNLSVIMPVGCNAKCKFCYWEKDTGLNLERFDKVINSLPPIFQQCSLTGGEPTLDNELIEYIKIANKRFEKVVLNTNGYKINKEIIESVEYINLSRHHFNDILNNKIFNTKEVPCSSEVQEICKKGNVTLNCFLPVDFNNKNFIKTYIAYAKRMNARVAFRKYYENLDVLEVDTDETLISSHSCGACLHRHHIIDGVRVTFKYSVKETFENMNGIYELILQANGNLTYDWAGNYKLIYKEK